MKFSNQLFFYFILYSSICLSQNMKEGFTYLETGKYKQAETFFENILITYPKNKTAKLCYGRALGLNGNGERATAIFINLLERYPQDFEIKLNYAESLLWNENYHKAKSYYKNLLEENPNSFPALLGYANTLSNLKFFNEALEFIDKALLTSPGNLNALTSKKYINLGYANQYVQNGDYKAALKLLLKNLQLFKKDIETLQNIANVYLISSDFLKAEATYKTIGISPQNKLTSLNSLALVSHLKGKNKKALEISSEAINYISNKTSESLLQQTKERYAQALIWNRKYKKAAVLIQKLNNEYPNKNWVLSLRASLNTYKSNFEKSINDYNRILKNDTTSFDGNLGKANALKASGYFIESYKSAENTLKFYKNQKDAVNFIKKLDKSFTPFVVAASSYSFDNGNNKAYSYKATSDFSFSTKFKLLGSYNYRTTSNSLSGLKATSNNVLGGVSYQLLHNIKLKSLIGLASSKTETNTFNQLVADISLLTKPFKLQNLELGYKREIQNFNAALLAENIVQNNYLINYSLNTNFRLGWFTQYYYTTQNDKNTRNLIFTSLYYNILEKPSLKAGVNYQNISFKNQVPTIYFSPSNFNAYEVFFNIIKDENITKENEWFYELTAASGFQYIENSKKQRTYRIQSKLGYKFSERSILTLYGSKSNIASATAAGFTFTEIGLRFKWFIVRKPFFRKQ
jgi:tetratricopeptide (TPR) repeat protein